MTKRNGNFNENAAKKVKVDDNIDALWGEDLDGDEVDNCLLLATQICEQNFSGAAQRNNVSVLPNYSFFKQNGDHVFTSTQCNINRNNVTSNSKRTLPKTNIQNNANTGELERKIEELKSDYTAKEGEVSMLRIQLKEIREKLESEHKKKETEWNNKIQLSNKELSSTKNELDFKNLEIANLKNKIAEATRNIGEISFSNTRTKDEKSAVKNCLKLDGTLGEQYPLRNKIDSSIFVLSRPEYFSINCTRTLSKFNNENDKRIIDRSKANADYNNFKLDSVFPYISSLINSTENDLNCEITKEAIDKVFFATLEITKYFHKNLMILEDDIQEETIRKRDFMYLDNKFTVFRANSSIFGNEEWFNNEIGIKSRRIIVVLSEILPYSSYLRQLILQKSIYLNNSLDNFFNLVQSVIKIIGVLRISERCVGFLCSVVTFMVRAAGTSEFCNWYVCIGDIIKEVIFARPPKKTIEYLSQFLSEASLHIDFLRNMCQIRLQRSSSISTNQTALCYSEESCLLSLFTIMYKENFNGNQENYIISISLLQLIKHVLNSNMPWIYSNDSCQCKCLKKIIRIGINIIHDASISYMTERSKHLPDKAHLEKYKSILRFSSDLLHIIKFNHMNNFNKYSVSLQYKFIVQTLLECYQELQLIDQEYEALQELNLPEEWQDINCSVLDQIPSWK